MLLVPMMLLATGPIDATAPPATVMRGERIRARYEVDLVGRSRAVFALPPGPRTIRSFRWEPDPDAPCAWRSARLRLVWDGDDPSAAAVDVPLGRFVAPARGDAATEGGRPPALVNRRPMPYRRTGRLVIDAEGPVRGSIRLDAGPPGAALDERGYLHAKVPGSGPSPPGAIPDLDGADAGPPVRYWYDRQPGPAPPPTGGRG